MRVIIVAGRIDIAPTADIVGADVPRYEVSSVGRT
jgi:hypothetical protein